MKSTKFKNNAPSLTVMFGVLLLAGLIVTQYATQQNQDRRGRAATVIKTATSNVTPQCSINGTVQFAISFTNPELYPIKLTTNASTLNLSKSYPNVAVGQTINDIIATNNVSVTAGQFSFIWLPSSNTTADQAEQDVQYNALNCSSPTPYSPTISVTPAIPTGKKAAADINDDGFVNQTDYNLFLREISTQPGQ